MSIMLGKTSIKNLHGPLSDFMDKLQCADGEEWFSAFKKFLRKENPWPEPTRSWRDEGGVIYFSVESDGTTGEDWIKRLEGNGFRVEDYPKQVLCSPSFKPTAGISTEVAVLKGRIFKDKHRITKKIRAEAEKRGFSKPNAELACLIREKFTDKEIAAMDLWWIVAMHEPVSVSDGNPGLLGVGRSANCPSFTGYDGTSDCSWFPHIGFAFAVSQKSVLST